MMRCFRPTQLGSVVLAASLAIAAGGNSALAAGDTFSATMPPGTPPGPAWVDEVRVQPDKAPDSSSLKSIVDTVTRGAKTNDEKAVAIYNYMILTHYHCAYPAEKGQIPAIKEINCYGWSLCGGLHTIESALWRAEGWNWRYVGWSNPGHTTVEAQYDGKWHYLDAFLKFYAWMPNGKGGQTIAGEDDIANDADALINNNFELSKSRVYAKNNEYVVSGDHANWQAPDFLACGDTLAGVITGTASRKQAGSPEGWNGIKHANAGYNTDLALAPGVSLTNTWDPVPGAFYFNDGQKMPVHSCPAYKDTRNNPAYGLILEPYITAKPQPPFRAARSYANGTIEFAPDFSNNAFVKSFTAIQNARYENKSLVPVDAAKPAFVVVPLTSPYILTKASGEATGADSIEVSTDGGKSYTAAEIKDFSNAVRVKGEGNTAACVKIIFTKPLTALKLQAIVQNNPGALPYLSPGKNIISVSAANPKALGNNKLVVTYAWQLGTQKMSFDQLCTEGKPIADGTASTASWSNTTTYIQKSFNAGDLPATFEIDIPTDPGANPVYPRMLFLRREVVGAGSSPMPLPQDAVEAKPAPAEQLQSLPNPFLVGAQTADRAAAAQ